MSSPNSLPPARFDRRVEDLYAQVYQGLYPPEGDASSSAPVLAICGGATDALIPSETCFLPPAPPSYSEKAKSQLFRETVFTTALEGIWTGVGHNEMVWCHQVREKVARTAIEMAATRGSEGEFEARSRRILDGWLDLRELRTHAEVGQWTSIDESAESKVQKMSGMVQVVAGGPNEEIAVNRVLLLPFSSGVAAHRLTLLIARGGLIANGSLVAGNPSNLRVELLLCRSSDSSTGCRPLSPLEKSVSIQTIPLPLPDTPFPQPGEGSNRDDIGVVVGIDDILPPAGDAPDAWLGMKVEGSVASGMRGLYAIFEPSNEEVESYRQVGLREVVVGSGWGIRPFISSIHVNVSPRGPSLRTDIRIPDASASSLVAYRLEARFRENCHSGQRLVPPLLHHISSAPESHFHALRPSQPILLHGHASGPFVPHALSAAQGLHFRIYADPHFCPIQSLDITVDLWSTLGRIALRYWSAAVVWGVGVAAAGFSYALWQWENGAPMMSPKEVYSRVLGMGWKAFAKVNGGLVLLGLVPLPRQAFLGVRGHWVVGVMLFWVAVGFVGVVMGWVDAMGVVVKLLNRLSKSPPTERAPGVRTTGGRAFGKKRSFMVLFLVITVIPHQVAFVISWLMILWAAATSPDQIGNRPAATTSITHSQNDLAPPIPLSSIRSSSPSPARRRSSPDPASSKDDVAPLVGPSDDRLEVTARANDHVVVQHILLLQAFLLPTQAPVLAVWIRTLITAGFTAPFGEGGNIFISIFSAIFFSIFWLIIAEVVVDGGVWDRKTSRSLKLLAPGLCALLSGYSFLFGLRYPFGVFELANVFVACLAIPHFGFLSKHNGRSNN